MLLRSILLASAVLVVSAGLASQPTQAGAAGSATAVTGTRLGIDRSQFTINGEPVFLYGASYYGALGAKRDFVIRDLNDMQRRGINWIRVWATWSAFDNDVSAVDDEGEPRDQYMSQLKWLIAECDRRKMVVDITVTKGEGRLGNAHVSAFEKHAHALEQLAVQLRVWRNWYLDMANEHNIRSKSLATKFVSFDDARKLRDRVRKVDPERLVTISYVRDASKEDVRRYVLDVQVDFLSPHRPRNPNSAGETAEVTRRYLAWMRDLGRVVPVHYQEPFRRDFSKGWQPKAEDFLRDLRGALQGGAAGWCFHNGDNRWGQEALPRRSFDMRRRRLFDQLDPVEMDALDKMASLLRREDAD